MFVFFKQGVQKTNDKKVPGVHEKTLKKINKYKKKHKKCFKPLKNAFRCCFFKIGGPNDDKKSAMDHEKTFKKINKYKKKIFEN